MGSGRFVMNRNFANVKRMSCNCTSGDGCCSSDAF